MASYQVLQAKMEKLQFQHPEAESAERTATIYSPFQHKARSVEQLIIYYISVIKYNP